MKNILILSTIVLIVTGCKNYDVRNDGVYYIFWNEAVGKGERLIEDADPKTFETLSNNDYGKDIKCVFYKGNQISGANPNSFELIKGGYAIDDTRAYYYGDSISTSSNKNFEVIDGYYSKDHKNIYYRNNPLNVCSVKDFNFVYNDGSENKWERWASDGCYYYMQNFKVPSEDYENIKLYKGSAGISSDSKYVYYLDRNIYYNEQGERILDTIDIESFKVTDYIDCEDKFSCINVFHGRKYCD